MDQERPKAPGLKWRKRADGRTIPVWVPDNAGRAAGYPVKYVNLAIYFDQPDLLVQRCVRLQTEMRAYLSDVPTVFNGTFGMLIDFYLTDPESTYRTLKPSSAHPYTIYVDKLRQHIGQIRVDDCDGRDVQRWFKVWAGVEDLRDPARRLPRARMMLCVLKAVMTFGVICKRPGCAAFSAVLAHLEFPSNKRRRFAPTAAQITAARNAAHAAGCPSRAIAYALQFETTLRQWDVIGQWLPISDRRPSSILHGNTKWIGPTWANIDENFVLRVMPTKTEDTTEFEGTFDLTLCPMVMEELAHIPAKKHTGPLIVHEATGRPYIYDTWRDCWQRDFRAAELPKGMWNRDLRAGGSTEASKSGANIEDRAKVAGHSPEMQRKVYDRDEVESFRRVRTARNAFREKGSS